MQVATQAAAFGLGLAFLLGLFDVADPLLTPPTPPGAEGPPQVVLVAGAVLGVITIAAVIWTWRTGSRTATRIVAGSRILSALTALPAFVVAGVPTEFVILAAVFVLLTVVAVGMLLARPDR